MSSSNTSISFILPNTQTPLFVAEWVTCAYPVSDLYAACPRYLYYALLVLVFLTQWHSWLSSVFLGVVATYAGTAAIEAFILVSSPSKLSASETVSIPFVPTASVPGNATLNTIPNLVTNSTSVEVQPATLDFDIDAVLAITVTGYLMMLPMHCWSSAAKTTRIRHLLIFVWNILMLAGMICALIVWPGLFDSPLQYRFCYPTILDTNYVTSDGHYDNSFWRGDWNTTIWNVFQDFEIAANLNDNCLYPCFNTSQVLRRPSSLVGAILSTGKNPRLGTALAWAGMIIPDQGLVKESNLAGLMVAALIVTTVIMLVFLLFSLSPARRLTRIPVQRPKELLWSARKEIFHLLWQEFNQGIVVFFTMMRSPGSQWQHLRAMPGADLQRMSWQLWRFFIDITALLTLFLAMIVTPVTIVVFIVWIEWYIHHDLVAGETPQQVGQWGPLVSLALVLVSALLLRLRYVMATRNEVQHEISEVREHLIELEKLLEEKRGQEDEQRRQDSAADMTEV